MIKKIKKTIDLFRKEKQIPIIIPTSQENLLNGKVALITGGNSGIGLAIAKSFLNCGAKVIIAGRNEKKLEDAKKKMNNPKVVSIVIDIKDVKSIPATVKQACALFPENRIDILVNSAGMHHSNTFENTTEEEYDAIMNTNLKGTYFMCQTICKYMRVNGIKGHVLNLSSSSAIRPATQPYAMSKWAIDGFTRGLARMYNKYGIVVNAIAPGQTATPMLREVDNDDISNSYSISGRYIMPEEVASLATYLVSDMANMVVGDTFYISGGSAIITYEG